jgi:hypothetical protein
MTIETPEPQPTNPDGTAIPTPDSAPETAPSETPAPEHAPDETPDLEKAGTDVPPETGTDPQTPAPDAERERLAEQAKEASQSPRERAEARREERREQREKAGVDPDGSSEDQPHRADVQANPGTVEVGGQQVDLTHDQTVALRSLPTAATATDSAGTERIVVPDLNADGWTPNEVEPDPREVARIEKMQAALEAKKNERLEAMQVKS